MTILTHILLKPDNLQRTFRYDANTSENDIFKMLMRDITKFFREHKYVDQTYQILGKGDDDNE